MSMRIAIEKVPNLTTADIKMVSSRRPPNDKHTAYAVYLAEDSQRLFAAEVVLHGNTKGHLYHVYGTVSNSTLKEYMEPNRVGLGKNEEHHLVVRWSLRDIPYTIPLASIKEITCLDRRY